MVTRKILTDMDDRGIIIYGYKFMQVNWKNEFSKDKTHFRDGGRFLFAQ